MTDLCDSVEKFGRGLGSTSRYRIVEALFDGPLSVGNISIKVKQSQPAVSQHLKVLKECSIVEDKRCGQEIIYSLNSKHVLTIIKNLSAELKKNYKK